MLWILLAILLLFLIVILLRMRWENRQFTVTEYTVRDTRFADNEKPVKVAVVADLHNREYGPENERLIQAIADAQPEAVLIAGDLPVAVPGKTTAPAMRFVQKLAQRWPVYYGVGNHEYRMRIYPETYGNAYAEYETQIRQAGVDMLHNECRTLMLGRVEADVYGLEMDRYYYRRLRKIHMDRQYLEETLPQKREGVYQILLAHSPDYFDAYAAWGADLVLSGHVHGGLVRLFGHGLVSPSTGLFPKYSGGVYQKGSTRMYVSRGLGAHTLPIRLFNVPELLVLTFTD